MNEQIKKLKVGQKVWVDNLEKDRLEKWIDKIGDDQLGYCGK